MFWSYNALRDHAQVCAAGVATEAFKCVKCSYSSKSEKNVKQHVKKHDWVSSTSRNTTGQAQTAHEYNYIFAENVLFVNLVCVARS